MKINLAAIKAVVTSKAARQILMTREHSPKILFVAGAVGFVGTVILACRATLKVSDVLDEHDKTQVNFIDEGYGTGSDTKEEWEKASRRLKFRTAFEIARLYAPTVGLGALSVLALTGSHVILTKRNGVLMAAYATLDKAYREYRQRVSDEYGVDVDRKFTFGYENVKVEEKTADGRVKVTTDQQMTGRYGRSPYAEVFDERSRFFSREPGRNSNTIMMQQNWANDKLRAQGHLFLNEVYDFLGLPRTEAGCFVGWVYRYDGEPKNGDNYVSFGVFEGEPEWVDAFIDGTEKYVTLDFNVDGVIHKLIADIAKGR